MIVDEAVVAGVAYELVSGDVSVSSPSLVPVKLKLLAPSPSSWRHDQVVQLPLDISHYCFHHLACHM